MEARIRRATSEDYAALCELVAEVDAMHAHHLPQIFRVPTGSAQDRPYVASWIADESAGLFVADVSGALAGFVLVEVEDTSDNPILVPRRYASVGDIDIRSDMRGRGIGRMLMNATSAWAAARGATSIYLSVYEFNQAARAFYEKLGYRTSLRRMVCAELNSEKSRPPAGPLEGRSVDAVIRRATTGDYAPLCELFAEVDVLHAAHLPHLFRTPPGPARDRAYFDELIAGENTCLFVAEQSGTLAGFVQVVVRDTSDIPILVPRRYASVDNLGVESQFRRRGIGCLLMQTVAEWAVAHGATSVELSVHEFNEAARAFYERLGYRTLLRRMSRPLPGP